MWGPDQSVVQQTATKIAQALSMKFGSLTSLWLPEWIGVHAQLEMSPTSRNCLESHWLQTSEDNDTAYKLSKEVLSLCESNLPNGHKICISSNHPLALLIHTRLTRSRSKKGREIQCSTPISRAWFVVLYQFGWPPATPVMLEDIWNLPLATSQKTLFLLRW